MPPEGALYLFLLGLASGVTLLTISAYRRVSPGWLKWMLVACGALVISRYATMALFASAETPEHVWRVRHCWFASYLGLTLPSVFAIDQLLRHPAMTPKKLLGWFSPFLLAYGALILAAGRGERLRPHTDRCPKPLLPVRGQPLIAWHLQALAAAGVREVVVNTAWLEDQFPAVLGDGAAFGLRLHYSMEGRDHGGALETAGGIAKALPLLDEVFWVVSGDVFLPGFRFVGTLADHLDCQLWMVPNAPHHPQGDFGLTADGHHKLVFGFGGIRQRDAT